MWGAPVLVSLLLSTIASCWIKRDVITMEGRSGGRGCLVERDVAMLEGARRVSQVGLAVRGGAGETHKYERARVTRLPCLRYGTSTSEKFLRISDEKPSSPSAVRASRSRSRTSWCERIRRLMTAALKGTPKVGSTLANLRVDSKVSRCDREG